MNESLLKQLDSLLGDYLYQINFDKAVPKTLVTTHFHDIAAPLTRQFKTKNQLGEHANAFIETAHEKYKNGVISPPISVITVENIYYEFAQIDKDLMGDLSQWDAFWQQVMDKNKNIYNGVLMTLKHDVLASYRLRTITFAFDIDEYREREFLLMFNHYVGTSSAHAAYDTLIKKLQANFEKDIVFDLQSLTRYLNVNNQAEFLQKFEEMISRKSVMFLGERAHVNIFASLIKDKEFIRQLPDLLCVSEVLGQFMRNLPEKIKSKYLIQEEVLSASQLAMINTSAPKNTRHV